jgi:hypothetical protein
MSEPDEPGEPFPPEEMGEPLPPEEMGLPLQAGETGVFVLPPLPGGQNREVILARSGVPTLRSWFGLGLSPEVSRLSASSEAIGVFPLSAVEPDGKTRLLGFVELSEGPAFGREVLASVARLGSLTGLAAISWPPGRAGWSAAG